MMKSFMRGGMEDAEIIDDPEDERGDQETQADDPEPASPEPARAVDHTSEKAPEVRERRAPTDMIRNRVRRVTSRPDASSTDDTDNH
jgi:hypothetical protein